MRADQGVRDRRVHIRLPERMYADVRALARHEGLTITGLIEQALRERIARNISTQEPESI